MSHKINDLVTLLEREFDADSIVHGDALSSRNSGYCEENHSAGILLLPQSTADVVRICEIATKEGLSIVPHGGLTGLVEGTASETGQLCVSFERMNKIIQVDPDQGIVVAESGVVLQNLFEATEPYGLMPGVDIPSRGTCMLGGLVSTNAGGVRVIRYGMMRENILGLEAVLANGQIIDATNMLMKNNAGYDLKQLFIGSEGTLGLVTKIVLRLHPIPPATATALVASDNLPSLMALLRRARTELDSGLLSFEVMWPEYVELTTSQPGFGPSPIVTSHGIFAIVEVAGKNDEDCTSAINGLLESALQDRLVVDAVLASSEAQRKTIWRMREDSDAISPTCDTYLSYDVGLPLQHMPAYVDQLRAGFSENHPDRTVYLFGHLGDGNLHLMFPVSWDEHENRRPFDELVYRPLREFDNTTISAEHGIGLEKKDFLEWSRPNDYVQIMQQMKATLDPNNILNPGKVL